MLKKNCSYLLLLPIFLAAILTTPSQTAAAPLSTQEILDSLKAHQDKIKSIEAELTMHIFGAQDLNITQTGIYNYTAPNQLLMEIQKPGHQTLKVKGDNVQISINGGPFRSLDSKQQSAGMSTDLFYYQYIKQFYLDIDLNNKPNQGNLYRIIAMHQTEGGKVATTDDLRTPKAAEFIYDKNTGLITHISLTGYESMPPTEVDLTYEQKSGAWVPKSVLAKVITPGGMVKSEMVLNNKIVRIK